MIFTIDANAISGTETVIGFAKAGVYDVNLNDIPFSKQPGKLIIGCLAKLLGDANGDGLINSKDAIALLRFIVGLLNLSPQQMCAADMNKDGKTNSADVISILRKSVEGAPIKEYIASNNGKVGVTLDKVYGLAGKSVIVPINVDNIDMLGGGNISITYDSSVLRAVDVFSDSDTLLASNIGELGKVQIAFANLNGWQGLHSGWRSDTLFKIRFDVITDSISPLNIQTLELFTADALPINSRSADGKFVSLATPADQNLLLQNYPNPFNPDTWIPYQLKEDADVVVKIYSSMGLLIQTLKLGYKPVGFWIGKDRSAYWDGKDESGEKASSGIYYYNIQAGNYNATRKMIIVK